MGESTRPVYWGRIVITGRTVVGDMLEWALWVTPTAPYTEGGGGMYLFRLLFASSQCMHYIYIYILYEYNHNCEYCAFKKI